MWPSKRLFHLTLEIPRKRKKNITCHPVDICIVGSWTNQMRAAIKDVTRTLVANERLKTAPFQRAIEVANAVCVCLAVAKKTVWEKPQAG